MDCFNLKDVLVAQKAADHSNEATHLKHHRLQSWATTLSGAMIQSSTLKAMESYRQVGKTKRLKKTENSVKVRTFSDSELNKKTSQKNNENNFADEIAATTEGNVAIIGELFGAIDLNCEETRRVERGKKRKSDDGQIIHTRRARSEEPKTNEKTEASRAFEPRQKRPRM